jgi:ubiquinone/menaquinone biosynthesis C-methylase UbiE
MNASPAAAPHRSSGSLQAPLLACAQGRLPPNVALAQLISRADRREAVERALVAALDDCAASPGAKERLQAVLALWRETPAAWDTIKEVLSCARHDRMADACTHWAAVFDRVLQVSPAAGVAIYSLGRADLLALATASIVQRLREWNLLGADRAVLDLGCGTGRLARAIASEVGSVVATDISPRMLQSARQHCSAHDNVRLVQTSGRDLALFEDGCFDLISAVDVFPYLVSCEGNLAARHFVEAHRVLKRGGSLLILNYAYGRDDELTEVAALASGAGLKLVRFATNDFEFWDGRTFLLRNESNDTIARAQS